MSASTAKLLTGAAMAIALAASPAMAQQDLEERVKELEQQLDLLKRQLEAQAQQTQDVAAQAAEAAKSSGSDVIVKMKGPTPTFESADGQYSLKITGRIHADTAFYNQDGVPTGQQDVRIDPDANSGTNFRRVRLGVDGKIAGDWNYHLMLDAGGDPDNTASLYEGYLRYKGIEPLSITAGRHKAATGFSERVSSNDVPFIERSIGHNTATSPFSPPANGLSVKANGDMWYVDTGVWYGDIADDAADEFLYWNGRAALAPVNNDDMLLHVGAHMNYLFEPEQDGMTNVTFSDRPELRVSDVRWISASSQSIFANDEAYAYGFEAAGRYRNFWLNGEVNFFGMDQSRDPAGGGPAGPDVNFMGYYVQGGWIVTGETRPYSMSKAAWSGVKPKNPFKFGGGGWGALELALRYSYADLNDEENNFQTDINGVSNFVGVRGGEERNFTFGVNWYVNDWIRFMFNYIHVDVDRYTVGQAPGAGGLASGDTFDIFALRTQFKF